MATLNTRATSAANGLMAWAQSLQSLLDSGRMLSTRITDANLQGNWNAMPTYAANADGTQGATDGTPNTAHPIAGLDISASALQGLSYMVNDFITFMTSTASSPPQQNREATIQTDLG